MTSENSLPTDLREIQSRAQQGELFEFLFFWGHQPPKDGTVGTSCLSQWYPAPFTVDGLVYPTAEHWMMVEKAKLFGDNNAVEVILSASTPKQAKALGRKVKNFDHAIWSTHCRDIVTRGNIAKFQQNEPMREYLLTTSGKVLVEASPYDRIWGIGLRQNDDRSQQPQKWLGHNLLGFALMDVRDKCA
jgi:ribA/ribD-fused uncharacterized protein